MGKDTAAKSKDEKLREDMPPTFEQVEKSTVMLVDSSAGLAKDTDSKPHRRLLLSGARGQGGRGGRKGGEGGREGREGGEGGGREGGGEGEGGGGSQEVVSKDRTL